MHIDRERARVGGVGEGEGGNLREIQTREGGAGRVGEKTD